MACQNSTNSNLIFIISKYYFRSMALINSIVNCRRLPHFQITFAKKFSELVFNKFDTSSKSRFSVSPMHLITLKRCDIDEEGK